VANSVPELTSSPIRPAEGLGERILLYFSRTSEEQRVAGATGRYTLGNALDFAHKRIPGFAELVRGKSIVDFGCGAGWQTVAMHSECGARSVLGIDIEDELLEHGRALAERENCRTRVTFSRQVPQELIGSFDVAISLCSFEHFGDPAAVLASMHSLVRPGALVVISFPEPWWSPHGSHMNDYTKIPWVNVFFREKTVMRFRSRFRNDGATRYEDAGGGLNRMTIAKFERTMRSSGMRIEFLKCYPVRGLPAVARIPLVREFFTSAATCVLRKPGLETSTQVVRDDSGYGFIS